MFGPNWIEISAPFCCWNQDFCRSAAAFAVAEQNQITGVGSNETHTMPQISVQGLIHFG